MLLIVDLGCENRTDVSLQNVAKTVLLVLIVMVYRFPVSFLAINLGATVVTLFFLRLSFSFS